MLVRTPVCTTAIPDFQDNPLITPLERVVLGGGEYICIISSSKNYLYCDRLYAKIFIRHSFMSVITKVLNYKLIMYFMRINI